MDETAFDAFYTASYGRIVVQVAGMIGSRDEAMDFVQEAFVRAWQHRMQLAADLSPEAWVRTTAYRLAVSRWRRRRMDVRAQDRSLLVAGAPQPSVNRVAVDAALAKLPADQRRAIVLYHFADLSIGDIAAETGVPTGTVKARLSRARATLSTLLHDRLPEENRHV
jgi:RNA polymerase sigma-70 factor (ECF subfamily)